MHRSTVRRSALAIAAAAAFSFSAQPAVADVTVRLMHVEANPVTQELWNSAARDFEAANSGVTVDVQYLENEAYKARLPTLLQSAERPHLIYSWSGGVMRAQHEAGFLEDVTDHVSQWADRFSTGAQNAFRIDGRFVGAPNHLAAVALFYNKELVAQAGVDADAIETWDDFLAAVQQVKDAGITPIIVGGGEKWPMHFYWSYLVMRVGGEDALATAMAGDDGGFTGDVFVQAGERLRELAALDPFQEGWLATNHPEAAGLWGDGNGAFQLMGNWLLNTQRQNATDGEGLAPENIGILRFPIIEGGEGRTTDTLGGINGWLVTSGAPQEAVDFLEFFLRSDYQNVAAAQGLYIPSGLGTESAITDPLVREVADMLAASTYHQIFLDQDLGPSVGRVVNDISVEIAAQTMTPEEGAALVQEAWDLE